LPIDYNKLKKLKIKIDEGLNNIFVTYIDVNIFNCHF